VYPLGILPEHTHRWLYAWFPTPIIEFSREVLIHGRIPSLRAHFLLCALAAMLLFVGIFFFQRYSRRGIETL
jgi:ABC-type polysaccharide/polyol phosphate export permease